MNDFNPSSGLFNSSIMRFNNKYHSIIWEEYMKRRGDFINVMVTKKSYLRIIKDTEDTYIIS